MALFDPDHVHHEPAHEWFATHRDAGWATCPLTENGLVRVLSNPAYTDAPKLPAALVRRLEGILRERLVDPQQLSEWRFQVLARSADGRTLHRLMEQVLSMRASLVLNGRNEVLELRDPAPSAQTQCADGVDDKDPFGEIGQRLQGVDRLDLPPHLRRDARQSR